MKMNGEKLQNEHEYLMPKQQEKHKKINKYCSTVCIRVSVLFPFFSSVLRICHVKSEYVA